MLTIAKASFFGFRNFAKYFAPTHEWIDINGNQGTVGISKYAEHQMGEISFADFQVNKEVKAGDELGNLESVKSTSPIMAPMSGTIIEVNPQILDNPTLINKAAESDGWLCKMRLSDPTNLGKLMDESAYKTFLANK